MSKYISRTRSKIKFREAASKEMEAIKEGEKPMSNKILADIVSRREAFRARQAQRSSEKKRMIEAITNKPTAPAHSAPQPKLDEFEKEYEAFIAEQRRLKEEREAKEAAAKAAEVEVPVDVPVETPVDEVNNDVVSEADTTSENSEEIQIVETKPKKKSKKKKVVETIETVE